MLRPDGGTAEVLGCPVVDADRAVWSRVGHLIETWSFGREFVDDALPMLFAIATPRSSVAAAVVVLAGWALLTVVSTVILTVVGGLLIGLDMDPAAVQAASRVAAAGLLGAALATPMALASSWRRGYLQGFIALVALVVVTQIVTAIGAGAGSPSQRQRCGWAWAARPPPARCQHPAAATAFGCCAGRRRDASLVAARQSALNAYRFGIGDQGASNGTAFSGHPLIVCSCARSAARRVTQGRGSACGTTHTPALPTAFGTPADTGAVSL
jgi:hypothetical protein